MKVVVAGCRHFKNYELVKLNLDHIDHVEYFISEIVSGGCKGTDKLGERWAKENGRKVKDFPYEKQYGKAGGPIRNAKMARYAELVIVYRCNKNGKCKGSRSMERETKKLNKNCYTFILKPSNCEEQCKNLAVLD